jgi:D-alanyl-D-alanine carboxypeptidase (penicillin-binding protein 5/6)
MKQLFRDFLAAGAAFGLLCFSSSPTLAQDTSASAFIVIDHHSGHVLKEFNATKKLQVASLTKIATAVVVLDWAQAMGQNLEQVAVVPAFKPGVANTQGVSWAPGDRASLKDLLWAALLQSDNVAAETLAAHVGRAISGDPDPAMHVVSFVAQMNALARKLEMPNTRFLNPQGLDTLERKLPYSTAEDMAKLCAYAMSNPGFLFYVSQKERKISVQRADGSRTAHRTCPCFRMTLSACRHRPLPQPCIKY